MSRLIDLSGVRVKHKLPLNNCKAIEEKTTDSSAIPQQINQFTDILLQANANKLMYTIQETANLVGIGPEFLRRRIKSGEIKSVSLGDKQMIDIIEISRILAEGVK